MTSFPGFSASKASEAASAPIRPLTTIEDGSAGLPLQRIGNDWTRRYYGGDFHLFPIPPDRPAISLVFVQSRDGNTGASNPEQTSQFWWSI